MLNLKFPNKYRLYSNLILELLPRFVRGENQEVGRHLEAEHRFPKDGSLV